MLELQCRIVEPKNHTPYETWVRNLFAHVAKGMEIQDLIWKRTKKIIKYIMLKNLNMNCLDIFQGISIHYNELKMVGYFSLEPYDNDN
jgi:hypothetical protein